MKSIVTTTGDAAALVQRAKRFATAAHEAVGQVRRYTSEPYIVHLEAVARLVATVPHDAAMLAAAWLHDVVEDTGVGSTDVHSVFGTDIGDLVDWLTSVSRPGDGNRAARKAIDRRHLARAPGRAQTIKVADLIDNGRSIFHHDVHFGRVYAREAAALLAEMHDADHQLVGIATGMIERFLSKMAA